MGGVSGTATTPASKVRRQVWEASEENLGALERVVLFEEGSVSQGLARVELRAWQGML